MAETRQTWQEKLKHAHKGKLNAQELRQRGLLVGTAEEFLEQLAQLEQAGVQRVMLQWLDLDDMAGLEAWQGMCCTR